MVCPECGRKTITFGEWCEGIHFLSWVCPHCGALLAANRIVWGALVLAFVVGIAGILVPAIVGFGHAQGAWQLKALALSALGLVLFLVCGLAYRFGGYVKRGAPYRAVAGEASHDAANTVVRLKFTLNLSEVFELNRTARQQRLLAACVSSLGLLLAAAAVYGSVVGTLAGGGLVSFLVPSGSFVLLGFALPWIAGLGQWLNKRWPPFGLDICKEGVVFASLAVPPSWHYFTSWRTTRNLLVLQIGRTGGPVPIPRRCVDAAQWERILAWVAAGVGPCGKKPASSPR
jgi:hypothetical protein